MEFLKFLLYQTINNPAFFDIKGIEVAELIVNIFMTLVTFGSVLVALLSVRWAIVRDKKEERDQNLKTLNMINHITSSQRSELSEINDDIGNLLSSIDNEEMEKKIRFNFHENLTLSVTSPFIYAILSSIEIIEDKNISSKLSEYKNELSKILFEYHIYLSIDATNKISYNLNLINSAITNVKNIVDRKMFNNIDYVKDKKIMNDLLSTLKKTNELIDGSTKSYI